MRDSFGDYISPQKLEEAQAVGIGSGTIRSRLFAGWTAQKAISTPPRRQTDEYREFRELAKRNGISSETYRGRIRRGWAFEKAATIPLIPQSKGLAMRWNCGNRVIPKELVETAAKNGICYNTLRYRIYSSSSIPQEEIATRPPMSKREKSDRMHRQLFAKR